MLAACGSSASTNSTVTNKNAGATKGVNLVVTNSRTKESFAIEICSDGGTCKPRTYLSPGQTADMSASGVTGKLYFPDGEVVSFNASNPFVGVPYFEFQNDNDSKSVALAEGDSVEVRFACQTFTASREADLADYKAMRLTFGDSAECAPGS